MAVIVGGYDDVTVYSDVWVLHDGNSQWYQLVPTGVNPLLARQSPRLGSMGGVMWLMGGVPPQVRRPAACTEPFPCVCTYGYWR
jgi:hypothetical protein